VFEAGSARSARKNDSTAVGYIAAMSLSIRLLGTSASRPTVERNVSSLAIHREGETLMFDCGEGTQRQMMRYGVSFALEDIFFTHMHADHLLGVIGLVRTMALQGRSERLRLWGPRGTSRVLKRAESFGFERPTFPVEILELGPAEPVKRNGYAIVPFPVDHRGSASLGYALVEEERKGRFNPDLARELGVPEGPMWGQIHRGIPVTLDDGRVIEPKVLVGEKRPGRTVVITGDTRPCAATIDASRNADVLIHEATFGEEEAERAVETGHSTTREAATVAHEAGARRLVLTHFSARYSRDASELGHEAKRVFAETVIGKDGMELDVPFRV
jgi:ribonuclease Z